MAVDMAEIANPGNTALMLMEIQQAVIGKATPPLFTALRDSAEKVGLAKNAGMLLRAARGVGVKVFHCPAYHRAGQEGFITNCRLAQAVKRADMPMGLGSEGVDFLPEVKPQGDEFIIWRFHSPTLFHDSSVDSICRNLGITTVVLTGVSLNLGIPGSTIEAMNRNYRVVIPTDCVAGYPPEYGEMVLKNTLHGLAYLTTARELAEAWGVRH
ncbi:MAG TPA: cysteine hydrolase [Candidatus Binataceae bacterium]|nr:cysteine hydrolase [Candidatus Binataceae bacterium]